jgi:hypothetical protein
MSVVALVHPSGTATVSVRRLAGQCTLFAGDPALAAPPYTVRASVPLSLFRDFVAALEGEAIQITNGTVGGLSLLCAEFGFQALTAKLSEFRASPAFRPAQAMDDCEARLRLAALEERWRDRDHEIARLCSRMSRLEAEVSELRSESRGPREGSMEDGPPKKAQPARADNPPRPASSRGDRSDAAPPAGPAPAKSQGGRANPAPPAQPPERLDSLIISDTPAILAEFKGKRSSVLWRDSRDGFAAADFHRQCDGHANTLILILDIGGSISSGAGMIE